MPDDEELECAPSKRKLLHWTAFLNSLGHSTGFSTSKAFNKEKVTQDWISWNCQQLGLPIPHLLEFKDHACTCDRFAFDSTAITSTHTTRGRHDRRTRAHPHGCATAIQPGGLHNRAQKRAT